MNFDFSQLINQIFFGSLIGSFNSGMKDNKEPLTVKTGLKRALKLLTNLYASYQIATYIAVEYELNILGFVIGLFVSTIFMNVFDAITSLDWGKILKDRIKKHFND